MAAPTRIEYEWDLGGFGFRLAPRSLTNQQPHVAEPVEFLAQQISSTAEATYTDINRKGEFAFAQDRFRGGLAKKLQFGLDTQDQVRYAKHVDTSGPYILPGPKVTTVGSVVTMNAAPTHAVQRGSVTYLAAGTQLYQVASSTGTPVIDTTFGAAITSMYVFGGFLIVGLASGNFQYRASDTSTGAFTSGAVAGKYFVSINDLLYRAVTSTVSVADNPAGPWLDYDVGDSSYSITGLAVEEQVLIVGKEDGPYVFDQDYVAQPLVPELRHQFGSAVCAAMQSFNRDMYVSTLFGAIMVRPGEGMQWVGLDTLVDPALPGGDSTFDRLTADPHFLYGLVASATAGVYIWKRDIEGKWHNFVYRTDLGASATLLQVVSKIGSTSVNAVLFAYQSGTDWQLAYAPWPKTFDPTIDSAYTFETAIEGTLRTLDYSAAYPTVPKITDRLKVVGDSFASTRKVTANAWLDDETSSRLLAEYQKSPFSTEEVKNLPQFHRISLEFEVSSEAATAPKFHAFHLSTDLLPRVIRLHKVQFLAYSGIALASGGATRGEWQTIVDELRSLRAKRKSIKVRDHDLREFTAYIDTMVEWDAEESAGDPVKVLTVTIKEVAAES